MHFSYHPRGNFSALNEKLTAGLALEKSEARIYSNCAQALLEASIGFFQTFSAKKKFYYFKNLDPHFELAVTALSKTGLDGKALTLEQFSKDLGWTDALDRESGAVFIAEDHPMTGEIYDNTELLKKLSEKNVFRIRLCHNKHLFETLPRSVERNEVRVLQLPPSMLDGCAIAIMGERARFGAITAEALSASTPEKVDAFIAQIEAKKIFAEPANLAERKATLASFESLQIEGLHFLYSEKPAARVYDRTVFYFKDMDGTAFLDQLGSEVGLPYRPEFFETASLIRWGGMRTMQWLEGQGFAPEVIRGMCVIDAHLLATPGFAKKFTVAREKVLKVQNGHG